MTQAFFRTAIVVDIGGVDEIYPGFDRRVDDPVDLGLRIPMTDTRTPKLPSCRYSMIAPYCYLKVQGWR